MEFEICPEMTAQRFAAHARVRRPAAPFIVTPGRCSDMAGSSIASLKAER
jgi:hypothetical protein